MTENQAGVTVRKEAITEEEMIVATSRDAVMVVKAALAETDKAMAKGPAMETGRDTEIDPEEVMTARDTETDPEVVMTVRDMETDPEVVTDLEVVTTTVREEISEKVDSREEKAPEEASQDIFVLFIPNL